MLTSTQTHAIIKAVRGGKMIDWPRLADAALVVGVLWLMLVIGAGISLLLLKKIIYPLWDYSYPLGVFAWLVVIWLAGTTAIWGLFY